MGIDSQINYRFPYKWCYENMGGNPKVNFLLASLIERDYRQAKILLAKGATFKKIDKYTFQRCLFEFVEDYELMTFLVRSGFNGINAYCDSIVREGSECIDSYGYFWGLTGRALTLGSKRMLNLLFSNGFSPGRFWRNGDSDDMCNYAMKTNYSELIDMLISHCYPIKSMVRWVDGCDQDRNKACQYVLNYPDIERLSFGLGKIDEELVPPSEPKFKLFTLPETKRRMLAQYDRGLAYYKKEVEAKEKYLKTMPREDLRKFFEHKRLSEKVNAETIDWLLDDLVREAKQKGISRQKFCEVSRSSGIRSNSGNDKSKDASNAVRVGSAWEAYENDVSETKQRQFSYVDCSGAYRRWGDDFIDHKGNWCRWGSGFYDYDDNYIQWGDTYKDSSGAYRRWGDDFVDAAGNYVKVP